jgi:lipoate-protein ligase A
MSSRGEFKTPGGKLIAVEFEIRERVLCDVVVTGDFFLYPEEALPRLSRSLEGAPITLSAEEYSARVEAALNGVELLGSSPHALATAVERALQLQTDTEDGDGH